MYGFSPDIDLNCAVPRLAPRTGVTVYPEPHQMLVLLNSKGFLSMAVAVHRAYCSQCNCASSKGLEDAGS